MMPATTKVQWEALDLVEVKCPKCTGYLVTVPRGTPVSRGYCRACGLKFVEVVA